MYKKTIPGGSDDVFNITCKLLSGPSASKCCEISSLARPELAFFSITGHASQAHNGQRVPHKG